MAPGRTLATMFLTDSDMSGADDRPSDISSVALIITPLEVATDDRGIVAYLLPADTSLVDEFDVIIVVVNDAEELSSWSELVQRDNDGGQMDREPARQWLDGGRVMTSDD